MMSRKFVYLETSVISYLAARPSRNLVVAAHQSITEEWWRQRRRRFQEVISEIVLEEAQQGSPEAAKRRMDILSGIPFIPVAENSLRLADILVQSGAVPAKAAQDALHIAVCCANSIDFLLTWNCKHIANAEKRGHIEETARQNGFTAPVICTPEELLGE